MQKNWVVTVELDRIKDLELLERIPEFCLDDISSETMFHLRKAVNESPQGIDVTSIESMSMIRALQVYFILSSWSLYSMIYKREKTLDLRTKLIYDYLKVWENTVNFVYQP